MDKKYLVPTFMFLLSIPVIGIQSNQARAWWDPELHRLAANFLGFDNRETSTSATAVANCSSSPCIPGTPDGLQFYKKKVYVPEGDNVLYVTISATADTHNGSGLWMSCRADGRFCNPGAGLGAQAPAGWVSLLKLPVPVGGSSNCNDGGGGGADCHDNGINYAWCVPIKECDDDDDCQHSVALNLASSVAGDDVFIERANIFVDSSHVNGPNKCNPAIMQAIANSHMKN